MKIEGKKEKERDLAELYALVDNENASELFNFNLNGVQTCMTPFQIEHFVLNKKEFPTDFAQFQQAKLELYHQLQTLFERLFDYREKKANIKLMEGEIEELQREKGGKIKEARIELKKIEIEKNNFQIVNIKKIAKDKLNEALVFYKVYQKYKKFDEMDTAELAKHEEENWKIKSVYYPELLERYGLTPSGFLKLPHENGGLNALIALQEKVLNLPKGKEK